MKHKAFKNDMKPYKPTLKTEGDYIRACLGYVFQRHHLHVYGVSGSVDDEISFIQDRLDRTDPGQVHRVLSKFEPKSNGVPSLAKLIYNFVIPINKKEGDAAYVEFFHQWMDTLTGKPQAHGR
jgi:hypothetical protein